MTGTSVEGWLDGDDLHVVAPFVSPAVLVPEARVALVLLGSDLAALVWAASTGAGLLLRTTPRAERTRVLGAAAGAALVSSVDSLHSPILRKELSRALSGTPWLIWDADRLAPLHPDHAGRQAWVARHRDACRGGGLLWRHADRALAPSDAEVLPARPGALRRVAPGQPGPLLALGRGIAAGPEALGDVLGHRLGEGGKARRPHDLRRLQRRPWQQADRALRTEVRGVDAFAGDPGIVPGRGLLRTGVASMPSDLAVPAGAALGQVLVTAEAGPDVTAECVERLRRLLAGRGTSQWLGVAGDAPDVTSELMADLATVGMLDELRPARLAARVADQHRFRPPRADREPEYRTLYDDYQAAMGGLSLSERARFALTDRAPQDLRGLAERLGRDPASVADLLVTMDDDGLVTAFGEPLGGEVDWQATRGPRWDADPDQLASAVADLRASRLDAVGRAAFVLGLAEGCRSVALASALGVEPADPCGSCDLCDPDDAAWPASVAAAVPAFRAGTISPVAEERPMPGLDSLFAGLGSGPKQQQPEVPRWTGPDLVAALAGGESGRLQEALEEAGSPALLWLRGAWDDATSGRAREIRPAVATALVDHLVQEAGPVAPAPGRGVRRLPNGMVEVRPWGGGVGTSHRFAERPDTWELLGPAAGLEESPGPLCTLRASRADRSAWDTWLDSAREAVVGWLAANPGLPDVASLLPPAPKPGGGSSPWSAALAALTAASSGALDKAVEALPDFPGAEVAETLFLAALGEWATLWDAAVEALSGGELSGGLVSRLEGRALLALDPAPPMDAAVVSAWLGWAEAELGAGQVPAARIVSSVTGGRARDFVALAKRADPVAVADRAVAAGRLPEKLVSAALERHDLVDVLSALADASSRAPAVWKRHAAHLPREEQRQLVAALEDRSPSVAAAGAAWLARLDEAAAQRQRVLELAREGRLAEVLPLLAGLDTRDPELDAVRAQVAVAQRRFTEPLALALSGPDHDAAAWAALKEARQDGWLDPLVLLLRIQARRHPADGRRALWLARSLVVAGRWFEAESQFGEAASLAEGQPLALEREFEGVDLALEAGQGRRVGEWLVRLVRSRRTRALAREITTRLWAGKLPGEACEVLQKELQLDGSGLFAGALRALQDKRRR